jgi:hypothetical protein
VVTHQRNFQIDVITTFDEYDAGFSISHDLRAPEGWKIANCNVGGSRSSSPYEAYETSGSALRVRRVVVVNTRVQRKRKAEEGGARRRRRGRCNARDHESLSS